MVESFLGFLEAMCLKVVSRVFTLFIDDFSSPYKCQSFERYYIVGTRRVLVKVCVRELLTLFV